MAKQEIHLIREVHRDLKRQAIPNSRQLSMKVPSVVASEELIAEKAPAALNTLKRLGAMDLAEMLGLTPYLEGSS